MFLTGLESSKISPSLNLIIRLAYSFAISSLWVTIITNLSLDISFIKSIIDLLVELSKAPVGSSANMISGSLARARAIATLCICPPDNWFGFLWICEPSPTLFKASIAFFLLVFFDIPLKVIPISTLSSIEIWPIKL